MDRRQFLKISGATGILGLSPLGTRLAFAADESNDSDKNLVVVILEGGADPLSLFPPFGDDVYHQSRPTLGFKKEATTPLTDFFGLNRNLEQLYPIWKEGEMTIVHQFGLSKVLRSHGGALALLQRGTTPEQNLTDGFLSRAVCEKLGTRGGPLRALAVKIGFPLILQGDSGAISFSSIAELQRGYPGKVDLLDYTGLYADSSDRHLGVQGTNLFSAVRKIRGTFGNGFLQNKDGGNKLGGPGELGFSLSEIAKLIQAKVGLRVATTSYFGWDTHSDQNNRLTLLQLKLAESLAAFRQRLISDGSWDKTLVVVMTEFGRAVFENGAAGTDHGHGSAALLLGGGLKKSSGGKIVHQWAPLKRHSDSSTDLKEREIDVVHDFRDVFAEALAAQLDMTAKQIAAVFPGHQFKKINLFS